MQEPKKIVIKLPELNLRSFFSVRSLIFFSFAFFSSFFAYWYYNIRPFLSLSSAHVDAFSLYLNSAMAGRIVEMGFQEGDFVKRGQIVCSFDQDLLLAKQAQIRAGLDLLKRQVDVEKGRVEKAMESYLTSANEADLGMASAETVQKHLLAIEEAEAKSESLLAKTTALKAELNLLELELKKTVLIAPFDGVVLKRFAQEGAALGFGDPIYTLADLSQLWVEAVVPEAKLAQIAIGAPAKITLSAYPDKEFSGKLVYIGPAADGKGQIPVKVAVANPESCMKPNLTAQLSLKVR